MEAYVLILWITAGHGGGATSAEFDNASACYNALNQASQRFGGTLHGVCVPKAIKPKIKKPKSKRKGDSP